MNRRVIFLALAAAVFAGCSSPGGGIPSNGQQAQLSTTGGAQDDNLTYAQRANIAAARQSPGDHAVPNVFALAQGKALTAAQLDSYISPDVSGSDRLLVTHLMNLMPSNQRSDVVFVDREGRVISNNPALSPYIKVTSGTVASRRAVAENAAVQPMAATNCLPPDSNTGPYIRFISVCGMTTGWGFVNVPCGYTNFASGDEGQLYFELIGRSGSLSEGGFQYNNDGSIQPYVRTTYAPSGGTAGYQTVQNSGAHYTCGQNLALTHGATYDPSYGELTYTSMGGVPSNINPETQWVNMTSQFFYPTNQAWLWVYAPGDVSGSGTDAAGYPTPCTSCAVANVTSIAQSAQNVANGGLSGWAADGSYFGTGQGSAEEAYINWMEVSFGQYASTCNGTAGSPCEILASSNLSVPYGINQAFPDANVAQFAPWPTGWGPYETYDGIDTSLDENGNYKVLQAGGGYNDPTPPPPTPTPSPRPINTPNPCTKNPRLCEIVKAISTPSSI